MKKIFILFFLLPFSFLSFGEINTEDLVDIENRLEQIKTNTSRIDVTTDEILDHISMMQGYIYQILQGQNTAENTRLRIESLLSGLKNMVEILKNDVHTVLPSLDSNLQNAASTLQICQNYLYDIKNTTSNIYVELSKLGTISQDLLDVKNLLINKFDMIQSYFGDFLYFLSGILTMADQLKEDTGIIVNDISTLKNLILSTNRDVTRYFYHISPFSFAFPDEDPNYGYAVLRASGTNYFSTVLGYLDTLLQSQYYGSQNSYFSTRQNYLIISNLNNSVSLQQEISTNVAYIASVITNSHDLLKLIASNVVKIARHTMPTNIADQYETQQQEQIDQISTSYQEHENDMSSYESSLTHIPSKLQKPLDDGSDYITRLNNSSTFEVNTLEDEIYAALPDYHSSLANISYSLPIDIKLTPDIKQIFSILRKCVTTTIWIFTFLFSLFVIQKFLQFVLWIMGLLNPVTRDMFGNTSSGSLYKLMGG